VLYNWVYGGKSPLIHPDTLSELGYSYYFQADVLFAVSRALQRYFSELKTTGTYGQAQEHMATFDEFNEFVGLAEVIAAEQRYGTAPIPCAADSERR
jgi:2-methylisocitrate lyase-like PEP mutase family enzyme